MIDDEVVDLPPEQFGRPKAPAGTWGSAIRVIDPVEVRMQSMDTQSAIDTILKREKLSMFSIWITMKLLSQ